MRFFKLDLVRGVIGGIIAWIIGFALVEVVRLAMGLPAQFNPNLPAGPDPLTLGATLKWIVSGGLAAYEPAMVVAAIFFAIGFMLGVGSMTDWLKWAGGTETPFRHGARKEGTPNWARYLSVDYSHKIIGVQYAVTGVILLLFAGTLALIFRVELAKPEIQLGLFKENLNWFNTLVSAHGMIMIGAILLGVGGMSNYLVPLMIGANDMAFPRLNAFAYWINVPGAILLVTAMFIGGWNTGWTGYPPLSAQAPLGVQYFFLGVFFIGLSSILGALNIIVSTLTMRAPGMSLFRMPIFVWAAFSTAIIQLTATQLIGLSFLMVLVQRILGMGFFDPRAAAVAQLPAEQLWQAGGNPILFQHLFWFYSHPAVYVFILPGLGIISELLPVFSRKPLFGYKWVAMSSMAIALVGFLVWAHHMFVSGMDTFLRIPFMFSTLLVAVPTGVKFFSWVGTLWGGKIDLQDAHAVQPQRDLRLSDRRAHRAASGDGGHGPAPHRQLLRGGALPRHHVRRVCLPVLCGAVLLVSKGYRPDVQREAGRAALRAHDPGLLGDEPGPDHGRNHGHAPSRSRLRSTNGDRRRPDVGHDRRFCDRLLGADRGDQPGGERQARTEGRSQPLALARAGVASPVARAGGQLRDHPDRRGRAVRLRPAEQQIRAVRTGHDRRRLTSQHGRWERIGAHRRRNAPPPPWQGGRYPCNCNFSLFSSYPSCSAAPSWSA